jgi:hypothetical protein
VEKLQFRCPNTGQPIDVGIESELETLLRIRSKPVLARCPFCDENHQWQVGDAQLLQGSVVSARGRRDARATAVPTPPDA